jgi:hypothetical protein
MSDLFDAFIAEYPPETPQTFDGNALAAAITRSFGVRVPESLLHFWKRVGAGYFSERELYFFGPRDRLIQPRSLIGWNSLPCWRDVLIHPSQGGPVFFAEVCVGDQIGFRYGSDGSCKAVLFAVDTCELFVMTPNFDELIPSLLSEPHSISDPKLLTVLRQRLGPLPDHSHYAPIVPPSAGGSFDPGNYHIETAIVHVNTAIATWKSLR